MKSLVRWSTSLVLVGGAVLGSVLGQSFRVLALPVEQVMQKLAIIPVFTITDSTGAPLVASGTDQTKVAGIFISQGDANAFLDNLKKDNPQLASQVQVVPASLGDIYKMAQDNAKKPDSLKFAYVPNLQEVQSATTLLTQQGQKYEGGVPLFVAKGGPQNGYLTVQDGNQPVIPMFFEQKQLEEMLTRFKQGRPNLASTIKIEVLPLEGVMAALSSSNDQTLSKIRLVPSTESLNFLKSLPTTNPQTTPGTTQPQVNPQTRPGNTQPQVNPQTRPGNTQPRNNTRNNTLEISPQNRPK